MDHLKWKMEVVMRRLLIGVVAVLSVGVGLYAVVGYGLLPLGATVHPDMAAVFADHRLALYLHVFASAVAILVGPFQFLRAVRRRPRLHRTLGRIYLAAVALGGAGGLALACTATGGVAQRVGFAVLAVLWLATGALGLRAIRAGRVEAHRAWMIRNFALTFAAVTLRLELGVAMGLGVDFMTVYPWLGWACWVPNALVAELLVRRSRAARRAGVRPARAAEMAVPRPS